MTEEKIQMISEQKLEVHEEDEDDQAKEENIIKEAAVKAAEFLGMIKLSDFIELNDPKKYRSKNKGFVKQYKSPNKGPRVRYPLKSNLQVLN